MDRRTVYNLINYIFSCLQIYVVGYRLPLFPLDIFQKIKSTLMMGAYNQNLTVLAKWIKPSLRCFMFQITKTEKSDFCQIYMTIGNLNTINKNLKIKSIKIKKHTRQNHRNKLYFTVYNQKLSYQKLLRFYIFITDN